MLLHGQLWGSAASLSCLRGTDSAVAAESLHLEDFRQRSLAAIATIRQLYSTCKHGEGSEICGHAQLGLLVTDWSVAVPAHTRRVLSIRQGG